MMSRIQRLQGQAFVLASLMCLMTGLVTAQDLDDTGIVHITDQPSAAVQNRIANTNIVRQVGASNDGCLPGNFCADGAGAQGQFCGNGTHCRNGNFQNGACQNGACPNGGCPHGANCPGAGYGCAVNAPCILNWLGVCSSGGADCNGCNSCRGKLSMSMRRIMAIVDPLSTACTHSPMHGFTPPNKRPYFRQPVSYQHNYPASWTGGVASGYQGHRPAVYMPTDTTQLGYYYQKVPTWIPVPGMIPPAPQPGEWHYYGPAAAHYAPACNVLPTEKANDEESDGSEQEIAPIPPQPEVTSVNLEKSTHKPNLLPIQEKAIPSVEQKSGANNVVRPSKMIPVKDLLDN